MKKTSWVNGLDSLRFFLALIVVLSHMPNPIAAALRFSSNPIIKSVGQLITPVFSGIGAVIAFFIISGFVIHYPNKNKEIHYSSFLIRRWVRLGIPLIVVGSVAWYFNLFHSVPIWSLYCELIYYTIYPLLVKIKVSWRVKFWCSFILATALIVVFCSNDIFSLLQQRNIKFIGSYWQLGDFVTWMIGLPCWLLGVLLAEEIDSFTANVTVAQIFMWRFGVFAISAILQIIRFKFYVSWIVSMNLFAFILFIWLRKEILYYRNHDSVAFFEKLGKFSYSLYLSHEVLMWLLRRNVFRVSVITYPIYIVLILLLAYFVFLLVEKPSHLLAQKLGGSKKPAV